MIEEYRNINRDICFIRVLVSGYPGQIRDITQEGMKVSLLGNPKLYLEKEYIFDLIPDESLKISPFKLKGEICWMTEDHLTVNFGVKFNSENNQKNRSSVDKLILLWK